MKKIGEGRHQEVFLEGNKVIKTPKKGISESEVSRMVEYYNTIRMAGIKAAEYYGKTTREGKTAFEWDYAGTPLTQVISSSDENDKILKLLERVLNYGFLAYTKGIAFFPILDQFTVLDGEVYFVDFFPSRTKEDFDSYEPTKRTDLGMMFLGFGQKIIRPTREVLYYSPKLRGIQNFLNNFLNEKKLGEFKRGLVSVINQEIPQNNSRGYSFFGDEEHFQISPFHDEEFDFVIQYPNRNIWTRNLFINDRRVLQESL